MSLAPAYAEMDTPVGNAISVRTATLDSPLAAAVVVTKVVLIRDLAMPRRDAPATIKGSVLARYIACLQHFAPSVCHQAPFQKNVRGQKCRDCTPTSFSLEASNPNGCTECFCFNRTNFCIQSSYVWQQVCWCGSHGAIQLAYETFFVRSTPRIDTRSSSNRGSTTITCTVFTSSPASRIL